MISEVDVVDATTEFLKNDEWKKAFEEAPGAAQMRMMLAFWFSQMKDKLSDEQKEEYRVFREHLEAQLKFDELEYLSNLQIFPETTRQHYKELLDKMPEEQRKSPSVEGLPENASPQMAWYAQSMGGGADNGGENPPNGEGNTENEDKTSVDEGGEGKPNAEGGQSTDNEESTENTAESGEGGESKPQPDNGEKSDAEQAPKNDSEESEGASV